MIRRSAYLLAGATATGKSAAAAILAREMGAAILSADSMLVYKGMDIGTAKPPVAERVEFNMGGVDLVTPAENFSSGEWLRRAARWAAALPAMYMGPKVLTADWIMTLVRPKVQLWMPPGRPYFMISPRSGS